MNARARVHWSRPAFSSSCSAFTLIDSAVAIATVALPSQRAQAFDTHQPHEHGNHLEFMDDQATLPIVFFDGSVRQDQPGQPRLVDPAVPHRQPAHLRSPHPPAGGPPSASGQPSEPVFDPDRFTRHGLLGWDFED